MAAETHRWQPKLIDYCYYIIRPGLTDIPGYDKVNKND